MFDDRREEFLSPVKDPVIGSYQATASVNPIIRNGQKAEKPTFPVPRYKKNGPPKGEPFPLSDNTNNVQRYL